nr:hypothetical protein [Tanacetum cinerariifolium]
MTTLVEFMIIAGTDNRPPMLEKSLYNSWKSCMELYIENQENDRMILNSLQNGPLVWPTVVEEDGTTRTKKYEELSMDLDLAVPVFSQGDDPITCLNKAMTFTTVSSSRFPSVINEFMIIAGTDNRPPMLEKSLYNSWKSCMELYIENQENDRMILNSLQNGPLVWPTVVEEDGTTRTKKYEELSVA